MHLISSRGTGIFPLFLEDEQGPGQKWLREHHRHKCRSIPTSGEKIWAKAITCRQVDTAEPPTPWQSDKMTPCQRESIHRGAVYYPAGVLVIMGQGALNQGVSKIEIPGKSQMALTTDKWLSLAPFAPFRRFVHPLIEFTINSHYARIWTARSVTRHTAN